MHSIPYWTQTFGILGRCVLPTAFSPVTRGLSSCRLAHITQLETEARNEFDAAFARIESFAFKPAGAAAPGSSGPLAPAGVLKKKHVVEPSKLVRLPYLETKGEVEAFLERLRRTGASHRS